MKPEFCPICKNKNDISFVEKFQTWDLFWCKNCDAQFWWPLKHPGQEFYEKAYDPTGNHERSALGWGNRMFLRDKKIKKGNLLDIGCSYGDFLNAARKIEFEIWGIDISRRSIEAAKNLFGFKNVYAESIDSFSKRIDIPKFDIVTFFDVIEHLDDPKSFVREVAKVLKKNGLIVFSTPDRECLKGWHDHPPQHLFKWSKKNLEFLLKSEGFNIVNFEREPVSSKFFRYYFFSSDSVMSFGIVSRLKRKFRKKINNDENQIMESDKYIINKKPFILKLVEIVALTKKIIFNTLISPIIFLLKLLGYKWQDLYIVAKKLT